MVFSVVAALDQDQGLGKRGDIPWHLPPDLRHFRELTVRRPRAEGHPNAVIMGRHTWESIPAKHRPLPERTNIVITRQSDFALPAHVLPAPSFDAALDRAANVSERVFVIGGAQIYAHALAAPGCQTLYLTRIAERFDCDVFFPTIPKVFALQHSTTRHQHGELQYWFEIYQRTPD